MSPTIASTTLVPPTLASPNPLSSQPRRRAILWRVAGWSVAAVALASLAGGVYVQRLAHEIGPAPLANADKLSITVVDREDRLLRAFTTKQGRWRLPVKVADVDKRYLRMLLAYEDRRFYDHGGVDPVAIVRAGLLLVRYRKLLSGASTLTMQAARLLDGVHGRTLSGKLRQMIRARQLEARLTKQQILSLYLRLAPMGGNIEGVRAASLAYFGKEPKRLSIGEAALLVAIPQSPAARRPDRHWKRALRARNRVIRRVMKAGAITKAEADRAVTEPMPRRRKEFPKLAPHLAESEIAQAPRQNIHRLTIDRHIQEKLELLARDTARATGSRLSAALMVIDHHSGQILGRVGAADYFDKQRFGGIDMTSAIRSPGSTLKPFIYGLAFEAGLAHPETLIEDRAVHFGSYAPKNFDKQFHGTVSIRHALMQSLNIPAVKLLHGVGPARLIGRFRKLGTLAPLPKNTQATLALALGGLGMRMSDLAALYASLAQGGKPVRIYHRRGDATAGTTMSKAWDAYAAKATGTAKAKGKRDGTGKRIAQQHGKTTNVARGPRRPARLMSKVAAWYVTDILKNAPPPVAARAGRIAYKTGTSYGFRDAWAAGFDGRHVIIAWVGRPDGTSTPNLTGRTAAAPMLFDAFARLSQRRSPLPRAPRGALRVRSGADLPPPLKRFSRGVEEIAQGPFIEDRLRIAFPPDRVDLEIETEAQPQAQPQAQAQAQAHATNTMTTPAAGKPEALVPAEVNAPIVLKAKGGTLPLTWLVNGKPIKSRAHRHDTTFTPRGAGFVKLTVIDSKGHVDRVTVRFRK